LPISARIAEMVRLVEVGHEERPQLRTTQLAGAFHNANLSSAITVDQRRRGEDRSDGRATAKWNG